MTSVNTLTELVPEAIELVAILMVFSPTPELLTMIADAKPVTEPVIVSRLTVVEPAEPLRVALPSTQATADGLGRLAPPLRR